MGLIRNSILSWVSSWIEIHLLLTTIKNQSLLTLNISEDNHAKGLPENANVKASRDLLLYGGIK